MCFEMLVTMADFRKLGWFKYISQPADLLPQCVEWIGEEKKGCWPVVKNYLESSFPVFITSRAVRLLPNYAQRQRKNIVSAADINKMKPLPQAGFTLQKPAHSQNQKAVLMKKRLCWSKENQLQIRTPTWTSFMCSEFETCLSCSWKHCKS